MPLPNFKYVLGPHIRDSDGGDSSTLLKRGRYYPQVFFIRSKHCTSAQPSTGGSGEAQ